MKKNGILTFHDAANYGAFLQAYALQNAIEGLGKTVEIINYKAPFIKETYDPYKLGANKLRSFLRILLYSGIEKRRNKIFEDFVTKHFNLSGEKILSNQDLENECRKFTRIICGSDQIWNTELTKGDYAYYLPFELGENKKKSYAASFGGIEIENEQVAVDYLDEFSSISVREKEKAEILADILNRKIYSSLDPTLLLSEKEWNKLAIPVKRATPYILIYTVNMPKNMIEKAIKFSKETGLELVQIQDRRGKYAEINYLSGQSPAEFLSLFRDAEFVFTNSFHGTVFSIIYKKQFFVELLSNDGKFNNRSKNLLDLLNVANRTIDDQKEISITDIDWNQVEETLKKEVAESKEYLLSIVE